MVPNVWRDDWLMVSFYIILGDFTVVTFDFFSQKVSSEGLLHEHIPAVFLVA